MELDDKEQMILALNQHGFMWIADRDKDTAWALVRNGYAVMRDEDAIQEKQLFKDATRLEITYLGIENANHLKSLLESRHA